MDIENRSAVEGPSRSIWISSNGASSVPELDSGRSDGEGLAGFGRGLGAARQDRPPRMFYGRQLFSGQKGGSCVGKTKRGKGTKIMAIADAHGLPLAAYTETASPAEVKLVHATLAARFVDPLPLRLIADKAYDSDRLRDELIDDGIALIAPHRKNRTDSCSNDGRTLRRYRKRWKIERLFAWLHNFRRLVVRWEYHAENYQSFLHLGCALILLRHL